MPMGGYFHFYCKNWSQKVIKTGYFAYFAYQWVGQIPRPIWLRYCFQLLESAFCLLILPQLLLFLSSSIWERNKAKCRFSQLKVVRVNAASDIFYSRPYPKGSRLGQDPSWKCFKLLGNGVTSGFSQREQASPYICGIFLLNLVEKTKRFYRKFYAFFFCQIMVKTKPKNVFTKSSMLLFESFLFLGEDFSHFCRLLFCRNLLHLGAHAYGSLCGLRKKFKKIKF